MFGIEVILGFALVGVAAEFYSCFLDTKVDTKLRFQNAFYFRLAFDKCLNKGCSWVYKGEVVALSRRNPMLLATVCTSQKCRKVAD